MILTRSGLRRGSAAIRVVVAPAVVLTPMVPPVVPPPVLNVLLELIS
jgi:hypothetical protein